MYIFLSIFIPIIITITLINHYRKKKNIKKINAMCTEDKKILLNELISPFGYHYIPSQDIFSSRMDAWQREFGYGTVYDRAAVHLNMVFDCLPVYFNYQGKTWLLELWKGQYGINTGCEIGLYRADSVIEPDQLNLTIFQSVPDTDMIKMSFVFSKNTIPLAHLTRPHWWLTAFRVGCFSQPRELAMYTTLTFPHPEMARAFADALVKTTSYSEEIYLRYNTVSFLFEHGTEAPGFLRRMRIRKAQFSNRLWCRAYLFTTRPFQSSLDKILYLYFYLPFAFRRMLRLRKIKKRKRSK